MSDVKFQVLGFKNIKRKSDGKELTILTACCECNPDDNSRGQYGMKVTDFFLPDDRVGSLKVDCIGQRFEPEYSINGFGRPQLSGFTLSAWK